MATIINRPALARFTEKLLAPLPANEVQPDDRKFLRQIKIDMEAAWRDQMHLTNAAKHLRFAVPEDAGSPRYWAHFAAVGQQMLVPAPNLAALKWKRSIRGFQGGRPEWDEAIARDEARLET